MNEMNPPTTFARLVQECERIVVPQVQRDYAQGRDAEAAVRNDFLNALSEALARPLNDPLLPLNLDFIYGSVETTGQKCFLPLDGQQRLTTLFLLHWYLAWRGERLSDFQERIWDGKHSRFSYQVRPSSSEFFDELVNFIPEVTPDEILSVRKLLENQSWFFLYWRLDPTIQSVLTMLDSIHLRFRTTHGLYARLVDERQALITFQQMRLDHFGLSDDLYIKMNARGKPLTPFETFKARFEEHLKFLFPAKRYQVETRDLSVPDFFAWRMDTRWTDFFWSYRSDGNPLFDEAVMNLFWALIRVGLNPEHAKFTDHTTQLRNRQLGGSFTIFHDQGWLTIDFADNLFCLLEAWSAGGGRLTKQLPDKRYFDEDAFFQKAITSPWALDYTELVQFKALIAYLKHNEGSVEPGDFQEWMRVIFNLTQNSFIERPEQYKQSLSGLQRLLPHSRLLLRDLAAGSIDVGGIGFSPPQVREEVLKAKLILAHSDWRKRLQEAEWHGYFLGQIEFLLSFCDVDVRANEASPADWPGEQHVQMQGRLDEYFQKANLMFGPTGLIEMSLPGQPYLWQRALLTVGNYLVSVGSNRSLLTNPPNGRDSWKILLRGNPVGKSPQRQHLQTLWDRLDAGLAVEPQLEKMVREASGMESWREAMVRYPQVITYCEQHQVRWQGEIYLLRRTQMNGAHAELFSFILHQTLNTPAVAEEIAPLKLQDYQSSWTNSNEPSMRLLLDRPDGQVTFVLESHEGMFWIYVSRAELASLPEVKAILVDQMGFSEPRENPAVIGRNTSRANTLGTLRELALRFAGSPPAPLP